VITVVAYSLFAYSGNEQFAGAAVHLAFAQEHALGAYLSTVHAARARMKADVVVQHTHQYLPSLETSGGEKHRNKTKKQSAQDGFQNTAQRGITPILVPLLLRQGSRNY
jgi:hypothetical protein